MENRILADTSILIGLQRGNDITVTQFVEHQDLIAISRITADEFIYGSQNRKEKTINKKFIENLEILEVDEHISALSYFLIDRYGLKSKLGIADALIAATAIHHQMTLWTENTRHFKIIKELNSQKNPV